MDYDVIIVGAGPAGLFAAEKLSSKRPGLGVLVLDKGNEISKRKCLARDHSKACIQCKKCSISYGIGGAGGLSDGKLNLDHRIGMDVNELQIDVKTARKLIKYIDNKFVEYGADNNVTVPRSPEVRDWVARAKKYGATLMQIKQRHMGSDKTPEIIGNFKKDLMGKGIEFKVNTEVESIENGKEFRVQTNKGDFTSKYLLVAPGRGGAYWFREQAKRLGLDFDFGEIDVGVRVELDAEIYKPLTDLFYDPKIRVVTPTHNDQMRTFCSNPHGEVTAELVETDLDLGNHLNVLEKYILATKKFTEMGDLLDERDLVLFGKMGLLGSFEKAEKSMKILKEAEAIKKKNYMLVNGHANKDQKTNNTNFALLHTIKLTNPQGDTTRYGQRIADFVNFISGELPLVQRYGDLTKRRSTEKSISRNAVKPTLTGCNPGDLGMALTYRSLTNIVETLEILDQIVPGIKDNSTLLYAPEIKFYDVRYKTSPSLETKLENLYVAGDGAGKARGIVGAALGGILAADGILEKLEK